MNGPSTRQHVTTVAKRLRLLQVEMHSVDADARAAMLREQLNAIVERVPTQERAAFLKELAQQFPDLGVGTASPPTTAASRPTPQPLNGIPSPEEIFLSLPPEKQAKAVQALVDRGVLEMAPAAPPPPASTAAGPRMDAAFIEFLRNVVPFFLRATEALGLQTEGLVDANVLTRAEAGISGTDPTMTREETEALLNRLALAISSLISVIPHLGKYCTQSLAQQLAAERIEDLSHNEGKAVLERWDAVYWRKYRQMSSAFSDGTLEKDINMKVAQHVDKWLQRTRRNVPGKG